MYENRNSYFPAAKLLLTLPEGMSFVPIERMERESRWQSVRNNRL